MALLYAHGGSMSLAEVLDSADSPPVVEAIIQGNPDCFVVGHRIVRLAWISETSAKNNRARRMGGGAA